MEKKGGRAARSAESKQRILAATLELASEQGYEGTTIAKVSKRSGLPTGSIYWHFGDKEKLFAVLLDDYIDRWFKKYEWKIREGERPADRVAELISLRAREATASSSVWALGLLMALERRLDGSEAREKFLLTRQERLEFISEFWRDNLSENIVAVDSQLPVHLARFFMAFSDGYVISASAGEELDLESLGEIFVTSVDQMIRAAEKKSSGPGPEE